LEEKLLRVNYLDVGSKLIYLHAGLSIALGLLSPLVAHLLFPRPFVFAAEDEVFTQTPWILLVDQSRNLALWLVLQADIARGAMLSYGIMTVVMVRRGLSNAHRWALSTIALSGLATGMPLWAVAVLYIERGLYQGLSGISLGLVLSILLYVPWVAGLIASSIGIRAASSNSS